MHKNYLVNYSRYFLIAMITAGGCLTIAQTAHAQKIQYKAPQDTVKTKRGPFDPLTTNRATTSTTVALDSRVVGAGVKAAEKLSDTTKYDNKKGIAVEDLFSQDDLEYVAKLGVNGVVALFEVINKHLPKGESVSFVTDQNAQMVTGDNPLVLKHLRAVVGAKPATIQNDQPQWKENVFQAYMARDYGTKLNNTITITTATREIRETPDLKIIDYSEGEITLKDILAHAQAHVKNKIEAEQAAVLDFREHTFPGKISIENANENYRRALFQLISLQENDINTHPKLKELVAQLNDDLKKGKESNAIKALKHSEFFDANVPGNLGPVLLTEDHVINPDEVVLNSEAKAMEITMLTALHYGERDAIKLLTQLIKGNGFTPAQETGDFTPKRLGELTFHGVEKLKSLGFKADKTQTMTSADLVLVAVASPDAPVVLKQYAFLNVNSIPTAQVAASIVNQYYVSDKSERKSNTLLFDPRISFGTRHTEYRADFDVVDFVPEVLNGVELNQKGSRITQNGVELRLESDLYFSNQEKIAAKGVKPVIFPEFGFVAGYGKRSVGYDNSTTPGPLGPVPQFKSDYINWGTHAGLNIGFVQLGADLTVLSTPTNSDPYKNFFSLSQSMTYYRYSVLFHVFNFGLGNIAYGKGSYLTLDAEFAFETNNEGPGNLTTTQGSDYQIGSAQWKADNARAHPNGALDLTIANDMIASGEVKASYSSSNYAALRVGLRKSNFQVKASLGIYNIYTVDSDEVYEKIFDDTFKGNVFGSVGITYNFGSGIRTDRHQRKESYQTTNGVESPHKVDESSSKQSSPYGPRDHAIFLNKKSRIKPGDVNTDTTTDSKKQ